MILLLIALVAAILFKYLLAATITVTFKTINTIPALSTIINTPETINKTINSLSNYIIIAITNIYSNYLSLSFSLDAGGLSLIDNPSPTKLANNIFT